MLSSCLNKLYKNIIYVILVCLMLFLFFNSLIFTAFMTDDVNEITEFHLDNILLSLMVIVSISLVLIIIFKSKLLDKINVRKLLLISILIIFFISVVLVLVSDVMPRADAKIVYDNVFYLKNLDYHDFSKGGYLSIYPHQLGLLFFEQIISVFFGTHTSLIFRIINCLMLAVSYYFMYKINDRLFHNNTANIILCVLMFLCLPPIFYCTFLYGNIISYSLIIISYYYLIVYIENHNYKYSLYSSLFIILACVIKSNSLISIIAIVIIYLIDILNSKKFINIVLVIILLGYYATVNNLIITYYEHITEGNLRENSMPKIAWIAMGINHGEEIGWYNYWTWNTFKSIDYDAKLMKKKSFENIKQNLNFYMNNKREGAVFFYKKISSAWNNPTYQCLWILNGSRDNKFMNSITKGRLFYMLYNYMNFYQLLIFFGTILYLILYFRKINYINLLFGLTIIGGFLFHILWEVKGQYTIQYFIMMLPYASLGLTLLTNKLAHSSWK